MPIQCIQIIVEQHADGFVAHPIGIEGIVVGQGDTRRAAISDVISAIRFHFETFGRVVDDSDR